MGIAQLVRSTLYKLYADRLLQLVEKRPLPRHVALILDGNRRFARNRGLGPPSLGHRLGAEKLDELLEWCDELAIPTVTVWALSMENLHRDQEELNQLIEVIQVKLRDLALAQSHRRSPRSIHVVGRLDVLPASLRDAIAEAEVSTAPFGPMSMNIALGYDGREEITEAVRGFLLERAEAEMSLTDVAHELTTEGIAGRLYRNGDPDPDLIIRTSGELRLSGFLLWQSANSELYFCDTLWPAFRKVDFLRAIRSYQERERRFGR